jgi:hypothetical protein
MRQLTGLVALLFALTAALDAVAGQAAGTTMRYRLTPGQVLVYKAVADIKAEASDGGDARGRRARAGARGEVNTHVEMVFSYTAANRQGAGDQQGAGEQPGGGPTVLTIEILDVSMTQTREFPRGTRRIEMDANGVRIYEDKKLVQEGAWGDLQLPGGLNLRALLDASIEASVSELGSIERFADPDLVRRLLQGANFLHLLTRQPVFAQAPIARGSAWKVANELVMANPLRLRELYRLAGTETYTAAAAVTHMNRRCLKLAINSEWPKTEIAGGGDAKARGSATAIVDFATGVMFAYSSKTEQSLEGTSPGGEADFDIEATAQVTYIGGEKTYEQYKAKKGS